MPNCLCALVLDWNVAVLFGGALGLLVSVMAMTRLTFADRQVDPWRRAMGHWLPVGIVGVVFAAAGRADMGIALAMGTSLAAMSVVTGFLLLAGPMELIHPRAPRIWSFLVAPAALVFIVGMHGQLGWAEALLLLLEGGLVMGIWKERGRLEPWDQATQAMPGAHWGSSGLIRPLQIVTTLALVLLSAWAVLRGAEADSRYAAGTIAATLLSIAMVMPMISSGAALAGEGLGWAPLTAQVGLVYLNLCLLVPAVVLVSQARQWGGGVLMNVPATRRLVDPVLFPRVSWRLDALLLLILAVLLLPVAGGQVKLDRRVGGWLIVGYCVYLLHALIAGMR